MRPDLVPERPEPLIEWGDPFLGQGAIDEGFELPTGAVWNPRFMVFGTARTALQLQDDGEDTALEWANRLDVFGNLQLSGTERLLIGFRPLDREGAPFSGYVFEPDARDGWQNGFDSRVETLFFEGDFGEIFPELDPDDSGLLDFGFTIGRQPLLMQDGLLVDDTVDAIGLTKNTLRPFGMSNLQLTALWAFDEVHRGDNSRDDEAHLLAFFAEADWEDWSLGLDALWIESDEAHGDAAFLGASAVRRIGRYSLTARGLLSLPEGGETPRAGRGGLLFAELGWTPHGTEDVAYVDVFAGFEDFTSAARGPETGGPLGNTGLMFTAVGLGTYASPIDNRPDHALGTALGYQFIGNDGRQQLTLEAAGRLDTGGDGSSAAALGLRYQQALGRRTILQADVYGAAREAHGLGFGARLEFLVKF